MGIRVALAQLNPTVGDLEGNLRIATACISAAKEEGADVVALPELAITGYPPEDLVLKPSFIDDNLQSLARLAVTTRGIAAVVGFVDRHDGKLYNAAALIRDREVQGIYHKHRLPNYGVFDEERYFEPGEGILLARLGETLFGITICEDLWSDDGPHAECAAAGASLIININGSPYHIAKGKQRLELLQTRARTHGTAFAYVNMVGGQDELVFDGHSMAVDAQGNPIASGAQFETDLLVFDFEPTLFSRRSSGGEALRIVELGEASVEKRSLEPKVVESLPLVSEVYCALVLGVHDYLAKNSFTGALVGLSGGIDSSLTAAIAADALGAENVLGISNPSEFTSDESKALIDELVANLGIEVMEIEIDDIYQAYLKALDPVFAGTEWSPAEENLQSRIRGTIWMAISNKGDAIGRSRIVLSTGNKSEMAVGYATLYGDMAGGFAVLKDVPKTMVYELARLKGDVIPRGVIDRAPSAELRHGQKDTDALPPYDVLDPILEAYVEDDESVEEIVSRGFDPAVVQRVVVMVDRAEYKRRQAPPGIKITERAFGRDRRLPISNRYRPKP